MKHVTMEELEAGFDGICQSPRDEGVLASIVRRPDSGHREMLNEGRLDIVNGLVGDNWRVRGSSRTADGSPHPDMQISIMNVRVIALLAGDKARWPLSGDQLFIDLDLSDANLPARTRLAVGAAIIEVTDQVHTTCKTFAARFGTDAVTFIHSPAGRRLRLRGINARVVRSGLIQVGDIVRKVTAGPPDSSSEHTLHDN
jgi:hypothetical protein